MPTSDRVGGSPAAWLRVFWRRKWVILVTAVVLMGVALLVHVVRTPIYEATARVLLGPAQSPFDSSQARQLDRAGVETEIQIVDSEPVRASVRTELGTTPSVSVQQVRSSAIISVTAKDPSASRAAAVANAYAKAYVGYRHQKGVDDLLAAAREIQAKIERLQLQINELDAVAAEGSTTTSVVPNPERDALLSLRNSFRQRLEQLEVERNLRSGGPEIALAASAPTSPLGQSAMAYGLAGLSVGLVLGIGAAFVLERLDDTVKTEEDLESSARGVPVLGVIPKIQGWKEEKHPRVVSLTDPNSQPAEAYRALRTTIQFMNPDRPIRTLQITSPGASEGKTTTLANLAVALARAGERVLMVSCDLRRPRIHEFFGLTNSDGFTSVLLGETPLSAAIQEVADEPRLRLLATGPCRSNPAELLSSQRSHEVLAELPLQADVVLLDCPPVLPVADAALLSTRSDGVILVTMARRTSCKDVRRSLELLRQVGAPVIGTILNGAPVDRARGYSYGDDIHANASGSGVPSTEPRSAKPVLPTHSSSHAHREAPNPAPSPDAPPVR